MSLEHLGKIYNALKTPNRIRTLQLIAEGLNLSEISEELEMSYASIHSYARDLEDIHLVEDNKGREITEAGEIVLEFSEQLNEQIEPIFLERWKQSVEETSEEFGFASPFSEGEIDKFADSEDDEDDTN